MKQELSFGQVEGFFIDSCVLLPHHVEAITKSCITFLSQNANLCILSSSVKNEAIELLDRSYSTLIEDFRPRLKPFLEIRGIKELTNRDGIALAEFFSERRMELKKANPHNSDLINELVGTVGNYVASQLHSLKDGSKISIDTFLAALMAELKIKAYDLKTPFQTLRTENIVLNDSAISDVVGSVILNDKDAIHLASAITYQFQHNKWIIFVTTDETDILSKTKELFENFALQCCRPEWAHDYHSEMSRKKAPTAYYREIPNHSARQKEFGGIIARVIGTELL